MVILRCGVIIMYKKLLELDGSEANGIKRISDGGIIPFDPANTSYQEYLEWLAEGNEPEAADE